MMLRSWPTLMKRPWSSRIVRSTRRALRRWTLRRCGRPHQLSAEERATEAEPEVAAKITWKVVQYARMKR